MNDRELYRTLKGAHSERLEDERRIRASEIRAYESTGSIEGPLPPANPAPMTAEARQRWVERAKQQPFGSVEKRDEVMDVLQTLDRPAGPLGVVSRTVCDIFFAQEIADMREKARKYQALHPEFGAVAEDMDGVAQ